MKKKISISIEENTLTKLDNHLKDDSFRNKSHLIEYAVNRFLEERE
ncbi:hypothetical protein HQ545_02015 [Candidatus Woesearchaeota archaeon]|nr:hypothetical protein [Candidatus Woesearchaeota archaeon]